ncbi:TonB-dependent receptor [Urechidicola sp. KH5]
MRFLFITVLLFSSIVTISQNCDLTLSGKIIDIHDDSPLVGATLVVADINLVIESDFDGNYTIKNLCEGKYFIQISHPECATRGFNVTLSKNQNKDFKLEHHLDQLNEISVNGKAFNNTAKTINVSTISEKEIEQNNGATLGDALKSLSGVSTLNTGNNIVKPIINGLHSSRVVIINNGVRMEDQEWGSEHAPNIDINAAQNITLVKGAGALQYSGDAIGGVIVVSPKRAHLKDSIYGKTLLTGTTNGRGFSATSQLTRSTEKGFYTTIQGTIKRFGDYEAPDYVLSNTGIYERNFSINAGINRIDYGIDLYYSMFKNDIGILRASHLGNIRDLYRAIESDVPLYIEDFTYEINPPRQEVTHHLAKLNGFYWLNNKTKLNLQYDFQLNNRLEFDIRRGERQNKPALDLQLDTHSLTFDLDTKLKENLNLKAGITGRYQVNFPDPETGVKRLIPDYDQYDFGIFAIADYKLNDSWLVEAGARFDYRYMDVWKFYRKSFWEERVYDEEFADIVVEETNNSVLTKPQLNFSNGSAMLGANYTISEDYKLYLNYSLASRAPNASELFSEGLHHSAARIEYGDLRIESEIGHKFSASLERSHDKFSFKVTPFYNNVANYILLEPTGINQTLRGSFPVWEYRQTDANLYGVDLDASYAFLDDFLLTSQFSFLKGYDNIQDEPLIDVPPVSTVNELVFTKAALNNLRLSLQSEYVFRQNEYPDNNFEVFIPETQTYEEVDISTPPDAYHLLNFNSSIDFKMSQKSTLNVGFSINNVFNTSYRNYLNNMRFFADELGRNFLLKLNINY